ncbi:hypothetical protein [Parablautia muri]|nr:hypothetical protein [Parablautia muri]
MKKKYVWKGILILQVFLLLLLGMERMKSSEDDRIQYTGDMLSFAQETESGLDLRRGCNRIENIDQGKNRRIITPDITLRRGVYAVTVQYHAITSSGSSVGCRSKAVYDGTHPWIRSESVLLTNNDTNIEYFVYSFKDNTRVIIKNIMDNDFFDPVQIDQVTITYLNGRSAAADLIRLLLVFGIVDVILYFYLYRRQVAGIWLQKNGLIVIGLAALLFIVELPMLMNYLPKGYDLRFHYYRLYSIAEGLRNGCFPVKIQPKWFNGYGYATGIFYGDIFLYFPALLYLLGFPLGTAYKAYVFAINVITIGNGYLCFKTIAKDKYIGLFGTVIYASFLHRLVALFTRAALGAYTALAFLPLVVLGLWAVYYGDDKENKKSWIYLVIGATGMIQSHLLGTLMTILFVGIFMVISLKRTLRKKTLMALGRAAAGCLISNLFFAVPFLDAYSNMTLAVDDYRGNMPVYYNSAFLSQLFSNVFNAVADVKEDLYGMYQDMPMSVGPMSGLAILAAICYLIVNHSKEKKENGLLPKLLAMTILSLWMSTNLFPYMWLEEFCPFLYAGLKKFEFAWRFLGAASTFITLLYVILMTKAKEMFAGKTAIVAGAVICMLFCYQGADYLFQYNNLMIPFEYEYNVRDLTVRAIYDGAYLPRGTDWQAMTTDIQVSDTEFVNVALEARKGTSICISVENNSKNNAYVDLPILYYKGYRAQSEGKDLPVSAGTNNRVRIALPAGFHGTIKTFFAEPWYWRGAEIISFLFWCGLIGYAMIKSIRKGFYCAGAR